jgi:DtxR family transcriptional regulator, Mn-dependent transcriptional regulator
VRITISKENYLKAIAEAEGEGETVIAATLSRWLKVSAPAVTMAIRRLKRDGLIRVSTEGEITLKKEGRAIADRVLQRHHLIERMLTEIFGMEWYKVHDEAEQLEHAVSSDFERRLIDKLGPNGHQDRHSGNWTRLDQLDPGTTAKVMSIFERDRSLLEYLDALGIRPAAELEMVTRNYDDTLTLKIAGKPVQLGTTAAARVWVGKE